MSKESDRIDYKKLNVYRCTENTGGFFSVYNIKDDIFPSLYFLIFFKCSIKSVLNSQNIAIK